MAVTHLYLSLLLLLFTTLSTASRHHNHHDNPPSKQQQQTPSATSTNIIHEACRASRDPPSCEPWLLTSTHDLPPNATVLQVIHSSLSVTLQDIAKGRTMVQDILSSSTGNLNRTTAANTCIDLLRYSDARITMSDDALTRGRLKDARAWTGAALAYHYDCWSALKYVNDTSLVVNTMVFFNSTLIFGTSSALGMMVNYDIWGEKTGSWGTVRTERDGFWEPGSGRGGLVGGRVPTGLRADVTVCKGRGCDYGTVQQAADAAPGGANGKRFVIWVRAGIYEETVRIEFEKRNVVLLGDGMGKTVITGSRNVGQPGMSTYNSATVGVLGDGFIASNLTIQNTAGPDAHQALAFLSDSDHSVIENCEFIGNQDTLYAHSLRQYYKSCRIQGNLDFIFGNSAAFFQDCLILVAPRQLNPEKGEKNAVTAHGRIDPAQSTGFVFQNSVINGTDAYMALYYSNRKVHNNFLGRPWKEYSRTVFIQCTLEALITPGGWLPWDGEFALKTLYYGEFGNSGTGAKTSARVTWSSLIPAEQVGSYSVQNFIQGDEWITAS